MSTRKGPGLAWKAEPGESMLLFDRKGKVYDRVEQLTWEAIAEDDFLLVDNTGRVYGHVEQMDEDYWWGSCSVMTEAEAPYFVGNDAYSQAKEYVLGMTRAWFVIRLLSMLPGQIPSGYEIKNEKIEPTFPRRNR